MPCLSFVVVAWGALAHAQDVTLTEQHLGREVGVDLQLADLSEVSGYFTTGRR